MTPSGGADLSKAGERRLNAAVQSRQVLQLLIHLPGAPRVVIIAKVLSSLSAAYDPDLLPHCVPSHVITTWWVHQTGQGHVRCPVSRQFHPMGSAHQLWWSILSVVPVLGNVTVEHQGLGSQTKKLLSLQICLPKYLVSQTLCPLAIQLILPLRSFSGRPTTNHSTAIIPIHTDDAHQLDKPTTDSTAHTSCHAPSWTRAGFSATGLH